MEDKFSFVSLTKDDLGQDPGREWLVWNGLGSYASGTVLGPLTRRYHGFLVAALRPPLARALLISKIEETVEIEGQLFPMAANRWFQTDQLSPCGHLFIERFFLDGSLPTWIYRFDKTLIEKKIFMCQGEQATYVSYRVIETRNVGPISLSCSVFANYRDFHALNLSKNLTVRATDARVELFSLEGQRVSFVQGPGFSFRLEDDVYYNYELGEEKNRGFDFLENHQRVCTFHTVFSENDPVFLLAGEGSSAVLPGPEALARARQKDQELLRLWDRAQARRQPQGVLLQTPGWVSQLVLSADAFLVKRPCRQNSEGKSVLAGYPWFGDWGRDTMISLPGLFSVTGREQVSRSVLLTYADFVKQGLIPNRFPDSGEASPPDDNTADATLWYIEAIRSYVEVSQDIAFLEHMAPVIKGILNSHRQGTLHGIRCDLRDGLLFAGTEGSQLTWMDAKAEGVCFTPRVGKPVEINALWYNAVRSFIWFQRLLGQETSEYAELLALLAHSFQRFWNQETSFCYDVLDTPHEPYHDATLRPNQLIALSLDDIPLSFKQKRSILNICTQFLVIPGAVRTLPQGDPNYHPHYVGHGFERDKAYHQGTAWTWLFGHYVIAYAKITGQLEIARALLGVVEDKLSEAGVGFLSEICDGDPPHAPRGCIAQAWGVAEILRAWHVVSTLTMKAQKGPL